VDQLGTALAREFGFLGETRRQREAKHTR